MKKIIISLFMAMLAIVASAVVIMTVKMTDGNSFKYDFEKVVKIGWETDKTTGIRYMNVKTTDGGVDKYEVEKVLEVECNNISSQQVDGYEYVDLGLPSGIMWATMNVGASKPEELGNSYFWGQVVKSEDMETKNNPNNDKNISWLQASGVIDENLNLTSSHDAATVNWSKNWRSPLPDEYRELINYCDWSYEIVNGVSGFKVSNKQNSDAFIFLPVDDEGISIYHTSSLKFVDIWHYDSFTCPTFQIFDKNVYVVSDSRNSGYSVRAVTSAGKPIKTYTVNFYDYCDNLILRQKVQENNDAIAPEAPEKCGYEFIGWDKSFTKVKSDLNITAQYDKKENKVDGYEYVDLCLPSGTRWATMNLGATKPEESGNYYSWGEVEIKDEYLKSSYNSIPKDFNQLQEQGFVDSNGYLTSSYDAVSYNWSENWRTPTASEYFELIENCDWEWTQLNGVDGYMITSKKNCNSIFLPAANAKSGKASSEVEGAYWCSNKNQRSYEHAYMLRFNSEQESVYSNFYNTYYGLTVRPVLGKATKSVKKYTVSFFDYCGKIIEKQYVEEGKNAVAPEAPEKCGHEFIGWDKPFTKVNSNLTVTAEYDKKENKVDGYEYVDLCLPSGTKWATMNVGAKQPEESGYYYSWGEVEPKNEYSKSKYTISGDYFVLQDKGVLDLNGDLTASYDAANQNWSDNWRMPTNSEFFELIENCDWEWTTLNGVTGYKVISKENCNWIFLPAANGQSEKGSISSDVKGFYWTSGMPQRSTTVNKTSFSLVFDEEEKYTHPNYNNSYYGLTVRPVLGSASQGVKSYTVTFRDYCDKLIASRKVEEGKDAVAPEAPEKCGHKFIGWDKSFTKVNSNMTVTAEYDKKENKVDGYEYVDLCLPSGTKWATMNVGAKQPEESGYYYSWGEVEKKDEYSKSKYTISGDYYLLQDKGVLDLNGNLTASYDAANQNWSDNWRVPTNSEFFELIENCDWEWTTLNGVTGYKVISKKNCNWIFLPAANGQSEKGAISSDVKGFYWTSEMPQRSTTVNKTSFSLVFDEEEKYTHPNYNNSYYGLTVRPVLGNANESNAKTFTVSFYDFCGNLIESQIVSEGMSAVAPEAPIRSSHKFIGWDVSYSNVKSDLSVTAKYDDSNEIVDGHECVDLGLPSGTKWATMNIGATSPEQEGTSYYWGTLVPDDVKGRVISESEEEEKIDDNGILKASYDVATQSWGDNWRMPTKEDFQELINYCDFEKITLNGHNYFKVTSRKTCNSIILSSYLDEFYGFYWSSTYAKNYFVETLALYSINPTDIIVKIDIMKFGTMEQTTIRPVLNKK